MVENGTSFLNPIQWYSQNKTNAKIHATNWHWRSSFETLRRASKTYKHWKRDETRLQYKKYNHLMVSPEPINQLNLLLWFLCRRPFIQLSVLSPRAKMHAPIFRIAALDNVKFIHVVCQSLLHYADNWCNMHSVEVQLTSSRQLMVYKASCEFSSILFRDVWEKQMCEGQYTSSDRDNKREAGELTWSVRTCS